jgi:hypothetical protein
MQGACRESFELTAGLSGSILLSGWLMLWSSTMALAFACVGAFVRKDMFLCAALDDRSVRSREGAQGLGPKFSWPGRAPFLGSTLGAMRLLLTSVEKVSSLGIPFSALLRNPTRISEYILQAQLRNRWCLIPKQ